VFHGRGIDGRRREGEAAMRLNEKVVVVTGSSRGLGKALADAFAAEGALVEGASRASGVDLRDPKAVRRFFEGVRDRHRRLDVLVNNAGVLTPRRPLQEVTDDEWRESLSVNLDAVFYCTREALRLMLPRRSGLIVNVSSGVAGRAAPTWGPYAAAKWGVEGLTKLLAEETREQGVRVVAINPARTRTAMRAMAYPEEDPGSVKTPEDTARFFVAVATGDVAFTSGDSLEYREV
jgi:NAD(P)-dependent dehydrogenase (short-subunit alcohol dehydrogenase family)